MYQPAGAWYEIDLLSVNDKYGSELRRRTLGAGWTSSMVECRDVPLDTAVPRKDRVSTKATGSARHFAVSNLDGVIRV